ncbi:MAG: nucleotidyltransferase domain-containing protein, partial [Actinomycetota bacterium]|nr:nucleotidyltransferase domain-containing protein [Actinomycetota bacterium]
MSERMTGALDPRRVRQPPGRAWCHAWTSTVDEAVRRWAADLGADRGLAVVALGSYARRQLCPKSDIDVLLLHDGWARPDLEGVVQRLCYPLWDAGLRVGHAVRTPRDTVRRAADRVDAATALVDRRLVAGDPGLADDLS